jgi:hypothetical protein
MKTLTGSVLLLAALAGCAPQRAPGPRQDAAVGTGQVAAYSGEVWLWDTQTNIVTLRQGERLVRVKVSPDQLIGLRINQPATVRGELVGPAEIEQAQLPPGTLVASGPPDEFDLTGTVAALDPAGKAGISSPRGPVEVWVATPTTTLKPGQPVRVRMQVQPLQVAPPSPGAPASAPPAPVAAVGSEPGDYATVRGQVRAVDPGGRLIVDSPRGPIQVWVPRVDRYTVGQFVEVRTAVTWSR